MVWLAEHGFTLLQSVGIIGGLLYTGYQIRLGIRVRRVEARFTITRHHRELWRSHLGDPLLARVLRTDPDLDAEPVTDPERRFVLLVILHLNAVLVSHREGIAPLSEGLEADIRDFFSKPIPRAVWEEGRQFRDSAFREHVEAILSRSLS